MRTLTGSRVGLADACKFWLQDGAPEWVDDGDDDAAFGWTVHDGAASQDPQWEPPDSLTSAVAERARRCVGHVLAWYQDQGSEIATEVGYRYDVERGRARTAEGRTAEGYRDVRSGEIPLTVDGVLERAVVEIKTGKVRPEHAWQVRTAAIAVARVRGTGSIDAVLLYVDADGVREMRERLDVFGLDEHAHRLRELWRSLADRPTPTPGAHCTGLHCPVRTTCPATCAALQRVQPAFPVGEITSDEQALTVLNAIPLAEAALDGFKARLRNYVRSRPLRLPSGDVYGWREHVSRRVAKLTAERIASLRAELGERADEAVQTTLEASIGSIEAAAREVARGRAGGDRSVRVGKETERIMGALVEAGVLVASEHERCETFTPRKGS